MICKYPLERNNVLDYVCDQFDWGHALAAYVKDNYHFEDGEFYTLLPKDINIQQLLKFQNGGIISSPTRKNDYELIPNVDKEIIDYLLGILITNNELQVLIEDVVRGEMQKNVEMIGAKVLSNNDHLYYFMDQPINLDDFYNTFRMANKPWYSFGLITSGIVKTNTDLSYDDIKTASINTKYMYFGAYDGEGFIFWEKF